MSDADLEKYLTY